MKIPEAYARAVHWNDLGDLIPEEFTPDTDFSHAELFPANAAADARNWHTFNAVALAVLSGLLPACASDEDLRHAVAAGVRDMKSEQWDRVFLGCVMIAVRDRIMGGCPEEA